MLRPNSRRTCSTTLIGENQNPRRQTHFPSIDLFYCCCTSDDYSPLPLQPQLFNEYIVRRTIRGSAAEEKNMDSAVMLVLNKTPVTPHLQRASFIHRLPSSAETPTRCGQPEPGRYHMRAGDHRKRTPLIFPTALPCRPELAQDCHRRSRIQYIPCTHSLITRGQSTA